MWEGGGSEEGWETSGECELEWVFVVSRAMGGR